jgi:hypothetical protein
VTAFDGGFSPAAFSGPLSPFESFEELAQPFLVRRSHGDEPHAQFTLPGPTHRRLVDPDRRFLVGHMKAQSHLYACVYLAIGLDAAATLRQIHDCPDRLAELRTREHTVKVHRKALVATEVHESPLGSLCGLLYEFLFG